jgi:hypothetical protein
VTVTPAEWEKRIKAAEAAAAKQHPRAMIIFDDPEGDLDRYRLPDWVLSTLGTIELGRPNGIGAEPESQEEWVARLTRDAERVLAAKSEG